MFPLFIIISIIILVVIAVVLDDRHDKKLLETVTRLDRGNSSERNLVLTLLKSGIPAQTIFHDLYVKKHNGRYSQIDVVVATKVGLVVFEVKDYSGWIFGTGYKPKWTQVLAYGKTNYQFYNPILQNNKHIAYLKNHVRQFEKLPFYSIVVFYGDCVFRDVSFIPRGTYLIKPDRIREVMNKIQSENDPANYTNKREVVNVLTQAVKNGETKETQIRHAENIRDMLGTERIFD